MAWAGTQRLAHSGILHAACVGLFLCGAQMPLHNVKDAMHEFGEKSLHSGKGGPVVKSRKQAIAIGISSQRRFQKKSRGRSLRKGH